MTKRVMAFPSTLGRLSMASSVLFLTACVGGMETSSDSDAPGYTEDLRRYEAEFQPSDYNPDVDELLEEDRKKRADRRDESVEITLSGKEELVSGFRVQILSSNSIDDATKQKQRAEEMFPTEWFYIIYDPPTYKIRAGNFITRFEADRLLKQLLDRGFHDAWIVPEKVYKDPPARE